MVLPLRDDPRQRPAVPLRARPAPARAPRAARLAHAPDGRRRAIVDSLVGAHRSGRVQRQRTVLVRCAVVVCGILLFFLATEVASALGQRVVQTPAATPTVTEEPVSFRVARPGDTLWSIAAESTGGGDLRERVDHLARLNGGADVRAGDTIRVPMGWRGR